MRGVQTSYGRRGAKGIEPGVLFGQNGRSGGQPVTDIAEGTRTFFFADLRDYTGFVERNGDRAAADLLKVYRSIVRSQVATSGGAEIKTEGDGFYIVFTSARQAIACGVAILKEAAAHNQQDPGMPIRVGIGVHAGEPIAQEGQFVGSAVNMAARIGAIADQGELLVSDIVRGLVRTGSPFPLVDRGEVVLKGIAEPVRVFAISWAPTAESSTADAPAPAVAARPISRQERARTVLVGRGTELQRITRAFDRVSAGSGAVVFVAGEPGIGKTRLASEAVLAAASSGFRVIEGRAFPVQGLAYALIIDAFGPLLRTLDPARRSALTGGLPHLSLLFSGLGMTAPPPIGEAALEKTRLFEDVARLLERLARQGPTAILLDDLQWADPASIELLLYLGRGLADLPVLVVATYRSGEADAAPGLRLLVRTLERAGLGEEIVLGRLSEKAVAEMAHALLSGDGPPELMDVLNAKTGGTPLFVEAMIRGLIDAGRLVRTDRWSMAAGDASLIPRSVKELILDRLERLNPSERRVLELIAVGGDTAWHAVLRLAGGLEEDPLLSAITHLTISGLIVEDASRAEVLYRVTHPMIQEVAYAELSTRARQRMHRAVAKALEEIGSTDVERLAVHYRAAGSEVDPDRAVDVLVAAGERARSRYAHDEVGRNLGTALTLIRAGHRSELLPTVLEQLGEAQVSIGERDAGTTLWSEALKLQREKGDDHVVARLHRQLAFTEWDSGHIDKAQQYIAEGVELLGRRAPSEDLADLVHVRLIFSLRRGDNTGASDAANQLLGLARQLHSPRAEAEGRLGAATVFALSGDQSAAAEESALAAEAAERTGDPLLLQRALDFFTGSAIATGNYADAEREAKRSLRLARELGVPAFATLPSHRLTMIYIVTGRWDDARQINVATLAEVRRIGTRRAVPGAIAIRAIVLTLEGDFDQAEACIREARGLGQPLDRNVYDFVEFADALMHFEKGDASLGCQLASAANPLNFAVPLIAGFLGEAQVAGGDPAGARETARKLRSVAALPSHPGGLAIRIDGLLQRSNGEDLPAMTRLAEAAGVFDQLGLSYDLARTRLDWARLAGRSDPQAAVVAGRQSLETFAGLGAKAYADRARQLLRELGEPSLQ
jgi:class 3 adenylate cyclase/tetratricopeptide (TPR) repeat protein